MRFHRITITQTYVQCEMSITALSARDTDLALKTTPRRVGPGAYEVEPLKVPTETAIPFNSTTRRDLWMVRCENEYVGPGSYNTARTSRSARTTLPMDRNNREYFISDPNAPGPADHALQAEWGVTRNPRPSCRPRRTAPKAPAPPDPEITPGPGDYNPRRPSKGRGANFSRSKTPQRELAGNSIPGPGRYEIPDDHQIPSQLSPAFRSKTRGAIFEQTTYDATTLEHKPWQVRTYSTRPSGSNAPRELFNICEGPDPGRYDPAARHRPAQQEGAFGATRDALKPVRNDVPGPGSYVSQAVRPTSTTSGPRTPREELWKIVDTPAPGQYEKYIAEDIARRRRRRVANPQFKGGPEDRDVLTNHEPNPGPAAYTVGAKSKKRGVRQFAKATRNRDTEYVGGVKLSGSPAPGEYQHDVKRPADDPRIRGTFARDGLTEVRRQEQSHKESREPATCELIRPSYNVRFDPQLKRHPR
jgi:hypothetical protein